MSINQEFLVKQYRRLNDRMDSGERESLVNEYREVMDQLEIAFPLAEGERLSLLFGAFMNMSIIYKDLERYKEAIVYFEKFQKVSEIIKNMFPSRAVNDEEKKNITLRFFLKNLSYNYDFYKIYKETGAEGKANFLSNQITFYIKEIMEEENPFQIFWDEYVLMGGLLSPLQNYFDFIKVSDELGIDIQVKKDKERGRAGFLLYEDNALPVYSWEYTSFEEDDEEDEKEHFFYLDVLAAGHLANDITRLVFSLQQPELILIDLDLEDIYRSHGRIVSIEPGEVLENEVRSLALQFIADKGPDIEQRYMDKSSGGIFKFKLLDYIEKEGCFLEIFSFKDGYKKALFANCGQTGDNEIALFYDNKKKDLSKVDRASDLKEYVGILTSEFDFAEEFEIFNNFRDLHKFLCAKWGIAEKDVEHLPIMIVTNFSFFKDYYTSSREEIVYLFYKNDDSLKYKLEPFDEDELNVDNPSLDEDWNYFEDASLVSALMGSDVALGNYMEETLEDPLQYYLEETSQDYFEYELETAKVPSLFGSRIIEELKVYGIRITFYNGFNEKKIIVPEKIDGKPVVSIGPEAFKNAEIEEVILPNSLIGVLEGAFSGCKKLSSIKLPDSLKILDRDCFCNCENLTSIKLPDSLSVLGAFCFRGCENLTSIKLPDSLTVLDAYCFKDCKKLKNVDLGKGVLKLEREVFSNCLSLIKIELPDSLREISVACFVGTKIETLIIPAAVEKVASDIIGRWSIAGVSGEGTLIFLGKNTTVSTLDGISNIKLGTYSIKMIYCLPGSEAQKFARDHRIPMKHLNEFNH